MLYAICQICSVLFSTESYVSYVRNRLPLVASAIVTQRRFSSLAAQIAATATAQFRDPPKRCTVSSPACFGFLSDKFAAGNPFWINTKHNDVWSSFQRCFIYCGHDQIYCGRTRRVIL